MRILILNSGSSSIKYTLFEDNQAVKSDLIERVENHEHTIHGVLDTIGTIDAVGHRVVHGAEEYHESVLIDEKVIETIEKLIYLAPL
ncbi:MAG TPA: acetate kinase, partial [Sulfuricurvum sp.]|nr:acetate kinase [Sulfuricurvum sp.]